MCSTNLLTYLLTYYGFESSISLCGRTDVAGPRSVAELQGRARSDAALPRRDEEQSGGTALGPDVALQPLRHRSRRRQLEYRAASGQRVANKHNCLCDRRRDNSSDGCTNCCADLLLQ